MASAPDGTAGLAGASHGHGTVGPSSNDKCTPEAESLLPSRPSAVSAFSQFKQSEQSKRSFRLSNWQDTYFCWWRSAFFYQRNGKFGERLEISFRAALWLVIWGSPRIWGLINDPDSFFFHDHVIDNVFQTGAIVAFVYTLAPTVGVTLNYALDGIAGTLMAATSSFLMYLVFPDGCSGADILSARFFFGTVTGAASIFCCLLLDLGIGFHLFYCANFVWYWMAFMDPDAPKRTELPEDAKEELLGLRFADWGGGVFSGVVMWVSGSLLALVASLLPYPMLAVARARDAATNTINNLAESWTSLLAFFCVTDRDELQWAKMIGSVTRTRNDISNLRAELDGCWWEMHFGGRCSISLRLTHHFLRQLDVTCVRCFERLQHSTDACRRKQFDDLHYDFMLHRMCGQAMKELCSSATALLQFASKCADDGTVTEAERRSLLTAVEEVGRDESVLGRRFREAMSAIRERELKRETRGKSKEDVLNDVEKNLSDEQIVIFGLCDFATTVKKYCTWLATECDAHPFGPPLPARMRRIFDRAHIANGDNIRLAARTSLQIFICFALGYVGYRKMFQAKSAMMAGTVAVLMNESLMTPHVKSMARLQGVVLGTFCGKVVYALLGWCYAWAQVLSSLVIFSYVWLTLFVYHYISSFSYVGCLAAAFGTQEFLVGCANEGFTLPESKQVPCVIAAIAVMTLVEWLFARARPSRLAFGAYLDAWATWDSVLEDLLSGEDTTVDPQRLSGLIDRAEALATSAAEEPRLWRDPFPSLLFSRMIKVARMMRTEVVCIHMVICEPNRNKIGAFSKKKWFKRLLTEEDSGWPAMIAEVLGEMDAVYEMVAGAERQNGEPVEKRVAKNMRSKVGLPESQDEMVKPISRLNLAGAGIDFDHHENQPLLEDEQLQMHFIYRCLQSIKATNRNLQLKLLGGAAIFRPD